MSKWVDLIPKPSSKFIKIKCLKCNNEQISFDHATTIIKCNVCNNILVEPRGGKAKIHGEIVEKLE